MYERDSNSEKVRQITMASDLNKCDYILQTEWTSPSDLNELYISDYLDFLVCYVLNFLILYQIYLSLGSFGK